MSAGLGQPVFRFAPSPNGRLHLGHAYCALLNADFAARAHGRLLLRIEDIDPVRSRPALIAAIQSDLAWLGLTFEAPVRRQSQHGPAYRAALDRLIARGLAYPCFCTRGDVRAATAAGPTPRDPDDAPLYPGTCRALDPRTAAVRRAAGEPHAWRMDTARARASVSGPLTYRAFDAPETNMARHRDAAPSSVRERVGVRDENHPERSRPSSQSSPPGRRDPRAIRVEDEARGPDGDHSVAADPARWGDPVIARRDGAASYHLAVVVDDAAQGVTHVVRGRDLEAATDLHVLLQALLGLETPRYHHHGLILGPDGAKLSKSKNSETLADLRARGARAEAIRARLGFA
ncbi:glutamate--tRNA ligase family protein [uncultured Methylobacterium sp.]|uniref:glutamate--tRNA ligase family protein n=1 Tax=uncultured Methylobacterium sp. TaxID=157278 RepID=UPI0035CB727D